MTKIECSTCGDMIEVTASTVTLPFICLKCEENMNSFTQAFDADTVKSVMTILKNPAIQEQLANEGLEVDQAEVDKFYEAMKPKAELTDEYASVENTTLLIEDLEKQLADAKRATVAAMMQQNDNFISRFETAVSRLEKIYESRTKTE
jgi:ribonuclease HIII